jgi:hypothetical protein
LRSNKIELAVVEKTKVNYEKNKGGGGGFGPRTVAPRLVGVLVGNIVEGIFKDFPPHWE